MALIALKDGARTSEKSLIDFCEDKLSKYKLPRKFKFLDAIPKNAMGKVNKKQLRADLLN